MPIPSEIIKLDREHAELRRSLQRSTAAAVAVFVLAFVLAVAAVLTAAKARRVQLEATENLWSALAAEADGGPAGKKQTLDAVAAAAAIRRSPELRDRAIAALARTEIRRSHFIPMVLGSEKDAPGATFSSDLETAFITTQTGTCEMVRAADGRKQRTFSADPPPEWGGFIEKVDLSSDDRFLVGRYVNGALLAWDVASGEEVFRHDVSYSRTSYRSVDFDPLAPPVIIFTDADAKAVRCYDLENRKVVAGFKVDGEPAVVAVSPDGERVAVDVGRELQVYTREGEHLRAIDVSGTLTCFLWLADGKRIAAGTSAGAIYFIDAENGQATRTLEGQKKYVHTIDLSPDGALLMTSGWDNLCRLWDVASGELLAEVRGEFPQDFSADGKRLGDASAFDLTLFDIDPGSVYRPLAGNTERDEKYYSIAFSPDGRRIAAGNLHTLVLWDAASGEVLAETGSGEFGGVGFSADGTFLVTGEPNGRVRRWPLVETGDGGVEFGTSENLSERHMIAGIGAVRVSGDGRWLSIAGRNGGFAVDLSGPGAVVKTVPALRAGGNCELDVSPDQRFVAYCEWKNVGGKVWDFKTAKEVARLDQSGGGLHFSPDSRSLATISGWKVCFWDTTDWTLYHEHERRPDAASFSLGVTWSSDGRFLAVSGENGTIELLDGTTREHRLLATLKYPFDDRTDKISFSPDGTKLAVAAVTGGRCHLWDLAALEEELHQRGLHWEDDVEPAEIAQAASVGGLPLLAGGGALAALVFGLFTVRHQRGLVRRFESVENVARQKQAELQRAETQLVHSQKMEALGNLSAGIAHDFRNLLSVIGMSSELIAEEGAGNAEVLEETEQIQKAVSQGDEVVRAMLGYSKGARDSGDDRGTEVAPVAEDLITLLGNQFLAGIELQLDFDPAAPLVAARRAAIEQCLLNFVVNASDAMGGRGRLAMRSRPISAAPAGCIVQPPDSKVGYALLEVEDSGPGIEEEDLPRVFEPFFSTKEQGARSGTGLGLSMVYRIASKAGFGIAVDPGGDGTGATFALVLPAQHSPTPAAGDTEVASEHDHG